MIKFDLLKFVRAEIMRVWIACFTLIFILAKLFDWAQQFSLPLPVCILGGVFLSLISNNEKLFGSSLRNTLGTAIEKSNESLQINVSTSDSASFPLINSYPQGDILEVENKE